MKTGMKSADKIVWTKCLENEFKNLKKEVSELKPLRIPDYEKKFTLRTDASNTGVGAVLMQEDENMKLVPVSWASKKFTERESRWHISEKEMFAVVFGLKKI